MVGSASMPILLTEAGLVFHLTGTRTWRGIAPFVAGSGGALWNLGSRTEEELQTDPSRRFEFGSRFTGSGGAGVDVFLRERLSVRLEGKGQVWQLPRPEVLRRRGESGAEWRVSPAFSAGAAIHF
jgi:hypothetical protein